MKNDIIKKYKNEKQEEKFVSTFFKVLPLVVIGYALLALIALA